MEMEMEIEMESHKRKMEIEMESDKRKRVMEGGIEEERFLFLGSSYNLFCIDLKKTEEKYGVKCSELSYNPLVAEVVWSTNIHATSDYLPFGMSSTRFNFKTASSGSRVLVPCSTSSSSGSDILLIGGELQDPSSRYCSTHASREVYKLVLEISGANGDIKDIKIVSADANIPRMKSGKASPIVEEIGGNLYVLHSRSINGGFNKRPEILFEVFDSKIGEWRTLPTPPFFAGIGIYAHSIIGHYFAIETSKECFSFDTIKEEWSCSENMTSYLINRLPMTVPSGLPCFGLDGQGRPLYVGISLFIEPSAYLVSPDGTIFAGQSLREIIHKDILPHPDKPLIKNVLIPLKSVEDNVIRMCACSIVSSNDFPGCLAMVVSFFSAKISPPSQQLIYKMISGELPDIDNHPAYGSFLDVFVERKFFFTVPHLGCFFNGPALLL